MILTVYLSAESMESFKNFGKVIAHSERNGISMFQLEVNITDIKVIRYAPALLEIQRYTPSERVTPI